MAEKTIPDLTLLTSIDRAADLFEVSDTSDSGNSKRTTINSMLNVTSQPVGIDDVQTLTNKTLTAPTISSPVLSGTITGTYTLGGTPTFPSAVATLTGSQTLTNKVLTSPTINSPTITNPTITVDTISEFTAANGVTIDGVLLKDSKMNGSYITDSSVGSTQLALGVPVQVVVTKFTAVATGTTTIPGDNTIPQNTEGTEFMTQIITPKSATNILVIECTAFVSHSAAVSVVGAIFQDTTANALAAGVIRNTVGTEYNTLIAKHTMVAGTASATTFKFRAGGDSAGILTFNGVAGAAIFGGITLATMQVTEYKAA